MPKTNDDIITSEELRKSLALAVGEDPSSSIVEELMRTLDEKKLFRYHRDEPAALISLQGRVLIAILEDPTLTQRAISVYLGCSVGAVEKSIAALTDMGMITKTKLNRKNVYQVIPAKIEEHSDFEHLRDVMKTLDKLRDHKSADSTPKMTVKPNEINEKKVAPETRIQSPRTPRPVASGESPF